MESIKQIEITIPNYRAYSRNKTLTAHWTVYRRYRDEVKSLVSYYCKKPFKIEPAEVTIRAFYRGVRSVDTSNIDDKIFIDALMDIGVLTNDTPQENPRVVKEAYINCGFDRVEVIVKPV